LADLCKPVTTSAGRSRLRSAASGTLCVPRVKLATYGTRAFAVAGPSFWNTLPDYLRNPALTLPVFKQQLKTFLFASYWRASSAVETCVFPQTKKVGKQALK
jgi:hypothetical protein